MRAVAVSLALLLAAATARAGAPPADCSPGPIPDRPVALTAGKTTTPLSAIALVKSGAMSFGEEGDEITYDQFRLTLRDQDDLFAPVDIDVTVLVKAGDTVDGHTFRRLPIKSISGQPSVASGVPEVQGWSIKNEALQIQVDHVFIVGSLRLEFDKRAGDKLTGRLRLCVAAGQKHGMDDSVQKIPLEVAGKFEAVVQ